MSRRPLVLTLVALAVAVVAAGLFFRTTNRWLNAAHIHFGHRQTRAPTAVSRGGRLSGSARGARNPSLAPSKPAPHVVLAPLQPHAFGWVRVSKATYYRVRFFRDGRQVFAAHSSEPRIVLPAHWHFHGRNFRLDPGKYLWIVQPGFGEPSAMRHGKSIVIADWVAEAAP